MFKVQELIDGKYHVVVKRDYSVYPMPMLFSAYGEAEAHAKRIGGKTRIMPAGTEDKFPPVLKVNGTVYQRTGVKIHVLGQETLKYSSRGLYVWISWVDGELVNARSL